jgi:hypothetical protein
MTAIAVISPVLLWTASTASKTLLVAFWKKYEGSQ